MSFFAKFTSGLSDLHIAAQNGDVSKVRQLVQKGIDLDKPTAKDKRTALHIAAEKGYDVVVGELLDRRARSFVLDADDNTPLLLAARAGLLKTVQLLLGPRNKDPDKASLLSTRNKLGYTPFLAAAEAGFCEVLEEMYRAGGPEVVHDTILDGCTALHLAARQGHVRILITVRALGGVVQTRNAAGSSALHFAAASGQAQAVGWLLNQGADAYAKDNNGKTPLEVAREGNNVLVARLLKDYMESHPPPALGMPDTEPVLAHRSWPKVELNVDGSNDCTSAPLFADGHTSAPLFAAPQGNRTSAAGGLNPPTTGFYPRLPSGADHFY